ncbi:MAG: hypothetical protein U0350_24945 [Caldilineaceae bacterium]
MKPAISFLRETLWILYALYFQPTALEQQLRRHITKLKPEDDPKRLRNIIDKLDQLAARRYWAQMALLCALAASPFLGLALLAATSPPLWLILLTWSMATLAGFGAAYWQGAWGPATALSLDLALAFSAAPGASLGLTLNGLAEINRRFDMDVSISIVLVVGGVWGWLARRNTLEQVNFTTGVVGVAAALVAGGVGIGVMYLVEAVMGDVVTAVTAGEIERFVTYIVSLGVALGMILGVAGVVMGSVADVMTGAVAGVVTVAGVFGVAGSVAGVVAALRFTPPEILFIIALCFGGALSARRWTWRHLIFPIFILGWLALAFLPDHGALAGLWLGVSIAGALRLPMLAFYILWSTYAFFCCRWFGTDPRKVFAASPWHWDELITFPLPYLDQLLVLAAQKDRQTGLTYIAEAAATWRQGGPAQRALVQLAAEDLKQCTNEREIARVTEALHWLPETLPRTVADTLGRFRTVSRMVDDKLITTNPEAQLTKLSAATAELDSMIQGFSFVPARERALFLPIAQAWREVLKRATGRLPNPYVAGDPLRTGSSGLFVGRTDVLRQLEMHLRDRTQRPALLLFGQRRMGKSSLLYQLPNQLGDSVVPVCIDCQAGEMREDNTAFLFNLARMICTQATEQRGLLLPSPPGLSEMTFTAFTLWLEQVEAALESRLLLLGLDEFEALGDAIENKWLDERVLGFLRNLIQHHPKLNILLAGSHRPQELAGFWSSYLISVNVFEISYLEPLETRRLIERPIPGFGLHYQPQAVDHIIALTRCQPLLVQLLCQELVHLLNERGEREAGVAEVEAAVPRALERGNTLYFNYLREYDAGLEGNVMLTKLAKRGQSAVIKTAELTGEQPAYVAALQRLLARDLVEEVEGGIRFEVELVRRWWAQQG